MSNSNMTMDFNKQLIENVWNKGIIVEGYDSSLFRKDSCGAWIAKNQYGNTNNIMGWEIDHIYPQMKGGDDNLENLRPMQWENNRSKSDDFPDYDAVVCADKNTNIRQEGHFTINETLIKILADKYKFKI